jgi:diacylglycerol kinase (ATP)
MTAHALLYINARSRSGREHKPTALKELAGLGIDVIDASDVSIDRLPTVLRDSRRKIDLVIIGGGDGTLNRVLETLIELELPVGVLPLGTANDLAATLGIPQSIPEACGIIARGNQRRIDLGWVNGKHFFNEGSLGLSTHIARELDPTAKKRWGILAIAANFARVVSRARAFRARLRCDDETYNVSTMQITVGNGERFGGFFKNVDADIADRRLDLYSLEVKGFLDVLELVPALIRGRYTDCRGVRLERAREIEVSTTHPRAIYTDGERTATTPALFRLVPSALAIFAPAPATVK